MENQAEDTGLELKSGLLATLFIAGAFLVLASAIALQGLYLRVQHGDVRAKEASMAPKEYKAMLAEHEAELAGYRWIDKDAGAVGVPVSRAMDLTLEAAGGGFKEAAAPRPSVTETLPPAEAGAKLYASQGCIACHSVDGTKVIGPSFKGLFGHEVELADGTKVVADEAYLRESIANPTAKLVQGFAPLMPLLPLEADQITALVEYIKTLQ